jgi:hypothetical protein
VQRKGIMIGAAVMVLLMVLTERGTIVRILRTKGGGGGGGGCQRRLVRVDDPVL